jgi:hypothetical protein
MLSAPGGRIEKLEVVVVVIVVVIILLLLLLLLLLNFKKIFHGNLF